MAAERPKRRITQPCLEYNGGLLHKEEIMLRRALYASLTESKKPQHCKTPDSQPLSNLEPSTSSLVYDAFGTTRDDKRSTEHCTVNEGCVTNSASISDVVNQREKDSCNILVAKDADKKKKKVPKEPSKLLNYVIKKKKKKIARSRTILKASSPDKLQMLNCDNSDSSPVLKGQELSSIRTSSTEVPCEASVKKKKRRQRGALAVFVAMNKSVGGSRINNLALSKEKHPTTVKKRKRLKRKISEAESPALSMHSSVAKSTEQSEENRQSGVESEGSPVKKAKRDQKRPSRLVHAQRKFARTLPLSPSSLKLQEEANQLLPPACPRAKTEDFLTFLCLRNNPVLPKELEIFNNPCLPMSPLSEEDEDNSSPPSPTQSQSSMSVSSNPSSLMLKSNSDSPALSVDSPAVGEGPCWESGVVRMFADGPKGLAGENKVEQKFEELVPSDEADDQRELSKSVTPPLAFRVSPRPTNYASYGARENQLPRPIPKPFLLQPPSLTRDPSSLSSLTTACNSNLPPPLIAPPQANTCCSPPPLLYIPAAAQRVTHLHGPPTLHRYPSTSPTRDKESEQQKVPYAARDDGPPPLKRFPAIVIDDEAPKLNHQETLNISNESLDYLAQTTFAKRAIPLSSPVQGDDVVNVDGDNSPTGLSKSTSVSEERSVKAVTDKEMPQLRRHSSTSPECDTLVEEHVALSAKSRGVDSRSSPPRLKRHSSTSQECDTFVEEHVTLSANSRGVDSRNSPPRLKRHSSTSQECDTFVEEHVTLSAKSRALDSRSSPPRLQRISTSEESAIAGQPSGRDRDKGLSAVNVSCSPPTLVRHTAVESILCRGVPTVGSTSSDSNSPPVLEKAITISGKPQSFPDTNCFRPIPVCEPPPSLKLSPALLSSKAKWKSTYVFSNRQTVLPAEKQPRPVHMTSFLAPSQTDVSSLQPQRRHVNSIPNNSNSQAVASLSRSNVPLVSVQRQSILLDSSHALRSTSTYTQANYHHSPSRANAPLVSVNTQLEVRPACSTSSATSSKRIPSPRSDLFGNMSRKSTDNLTNYSSYSGAPGDPLTTLRSTLRQKGNAVHGLPPVWSHMEPPYSSVASQYTSPRPYTFSVTLPKTSPPPLYSSACPSSLSSSNSTHRTSASGLSSLSSSDSNRRTSASFGLSVVQRVPVIQRSRLIADVQPKEACLAGETLSVVHHEPRLDQLENSRAQNLPKAFQMQASCPNTNADAIFARSSTPDKSVIDRRLSSSATRNDPVIGNLDKEGSSPPIRHSVLIQSAKSKSPGLRTKGKEKKVPVEREIVSDNTPSESNSQRIPNKSFGSSVGRTIDSPVFHPTEEEFQDPAAYIKSIRSSGEKFGVCLIVPPDSWKPEFQVPESLRFNSECQLIHRLLHRWGPVEEELSCIRTHLDQQSISLTPMPQIGGYELDLPQFSRVVKQFGGLQKVIDSKKWTKVSDMLRIPRAAQDRVGKLQDIYCKYLLSYDLLPQEEKAELLKQVKMERENNMDHEQDSNCWTLKGRNMSLVPFQRLARNVQGHFFKNPPSANDVEREFWRIVHNRESYVCVHRGTVDTNKEHSCFPSVKGDPHSKVGWNLNVLPHVSGSVLKHLGFVHDVTIPWLQFDMTFSVKSWQMHPLALFTVDYLHNGAEKIWYCVPASEKEKFTSVLKTFSSQASLDGSEKAVFDKMVSPSSLKDSGVTVTRVVQEQGQFVVVFPEAYYSSISCGYSISEAVAYAPPHWIIVGSQRYEKLRDTCQWSDFTFDRLLLGLAEELSDESRDVVECVLAKLKMLRDEEKSSMAEVLELGLVEMQPVRENNALGSPGGKKGKKTCSSSPQVDSSCVLFCEDCDRPCYLSAVTSDEEPMVLCLKHAAIHIREKKSSKGFRILNRYDTCRLDELVVKVEDRLKKLGGPS